MEIFYFFSVVFVIRNVFLNNFILVNLIEFPVSTLQIIIRSEIVQFSFNSAPLCLLIDLSVFDLQIFDIFQNCPVRRPGLLNIIITWEFDGFSLLCKGLCFIRFEYIRDALIKSCHMLSIERVAAACMIVNCRFPDMPARIILCWFMAVILPLTMFAQNIIRLTIISCRETVAVAAVLFFISLTGSWT